jgi:ABC-type bacteriocin/lantibiotic exporter with double-glycine peptidase domain
MLLLPITFRSPLLHQLRDLLTFLLTFCSLFTQIMLVYYSYTPYYLGIIILPICSLAFFLFLRMRRDQAVEKMVKKGRQ